MGKAKNYINYGHTLSYPEILKQQRKGRKATPHVWRMQKVLYWFALSLLFAVFVLLVAFISLLF